MDEQRQHANSILWVWTIIIRVGANKKDWDDDLDQTVICFYAGNKMLTVEG